jgi:glycosyltransferase involved in cell wall biosynthesis
VASKISLLFVGRYHPSKNLFSLIFAFKAVKNIHPELGLTLIGDGPLQSEISSLIANLQLQGSVQILNRKSGIELEAWYYRSDIFVLPSVYEPFGAVVDEALLQGCFVVCSSQAGAKVLIDNNNGLIFDPHKGHDELMKALIEAVCRVKTRVTRPYGILNRRIQFEKCMESLMDLTE